MSPRGNSTRAVHTGERHADGALTTPIYQSAAFLYGPYVDAPQGAEGVWYYTRMGNPTLDAAEKKLTELIGAEDTLLTASGMGAITTAVLSNVRGGDHIIASNSIYGGALSLLRHLEANFAVRVSWVNPESFAEEARPLVGEKTRIFYVETPTNPTLKLVDLEAVAGLAGETSVLTILDHTFASPVGQDAMGCGIDLVVHSVTKYIGGHSDLLAGSISGRRGNMEAVRGMAHVTGPVCDPHTAFLVSRGLKTLTLRMDRHHHNGLALARHLEGHAKVGRVFHPYLESHPQYELAKRTLAGGGGVLSFELADGAAADRFVRALSLIAWAPSLGSVESLCHIPTGKGGSHGHWSEQELAAADITQGLVRISAGVEDFEDLIADLDAALRAV